MKCPNCGKEMPADLSFCTSCGTKLAEAKKFCPNCGTENPNDFSFCCKCGAPLSGAAFAAQQMGGSYQQYPQQSVAQPQFSKQQNDYEVAKNKLSGEHDRNNLKEIITILDSLGNYNDAPALLENCRAELLELDYQDACEKFDKADENKSLYKELEKAFAGFGSYKESEEKYKICKEYCDKQRKKAKKTWIIISGSLVAAIAIVVVLTKVVIPTITYNAAINALSAGEYETAVAKFETLVDYKDSNEKIKQAYFGYGKELVTAEDFDTAITMFENADGFDSSAAYKQYATGRKNLVEKKYDEAIVCFTNAKDVEDSAVRLQEANYLFGEEKLKGKAYSGAITYYTAAGDYKDSKDKINACNLMLAEEIYKEGKLNTAKNAFLKLPADFSYNNIKVQDRLNSLNNSGKILAICGEWKASKNSVTVHDVYKRNGSSDGWKMNGTPSDQTISIKCTINSDGTYTIKGSVSYYRFTNYSVLSYLCQPASKTSTFTIANVNGMPSSYAIDSNTTLKYSNGVFSLSYYKKDNYSQYFYYKYSSSVTYGTRTATY